MARAKKFLMRPHGGYRDDDVPINDQLALGDLSGDYYRVPPSRDRRRLH